MSRIGRAGRRPDHWTSPHDRARTRAAERLAEPLSPSEAAWLETHLDGCPSCAAIAEGYATDRAMLRRLRDANPEPPRDLWARTATGMEREASARGRRRAASSPPPSRPAIGALSGLAVVAVVLVATALSGGFLGNGGIALASSHPESPAVSLRAAPTPLAVDAGQVRWLGLRDDGAFAYNIANVDAVCPVDRQPDCAPFADGHARPVTLTAIPKFVFQSPVANEAVVVGTDAAGADAVIVVAVPAPEPSETATPTEPAVSDGPLPSEESPTIELTPSDTPSVEPTASPGIPGATPSIVASVEPSGLLPASVSPSLEPSAGTAVAIITDVTIVGRSAGYSPDGAWFAFSARPADNSAGPDIYVWHVGDPVAVALTTDHASVFASWVGNQLLGSRATPVDFVSPDPGASGAPSASIEPVPSATPAPTPTPPTPTPSPSPDASQPVDASAAPEPTPAPEFVAQTFLIDPLTGIETPMLGADWQPVVDPTGVWVVAWEGTVRGAPDGLSLVPATGRLVVHGVQPLPEPTASPDPFVLSSESPAIEPSAEPTNEPVLPTDSPMPSASPAPGPQVIAEGPIAEFDARWDDTGTWLAVWIADPVDPSIGRLSLLHVDPTTGLIDRPLGAPQDVPALPGFSIGEGRLAWATPPGQGGEGSRIQIVAWTPEDAVGAIESIPVEGAIVVQ